MIPDFQKLIDLSADVLVILDKEGKVVTTNAALLDLLNETLENIKGTPLVSYLTRHDRNDFEEAMQLAWNQTEPEPIPARIFNRHHAYIALVWNIKADSAQECYYVSAEPNASPLLQTLQDGRESRIDKLNKVLSRMAEERESSLSDLQRSLTSGIDTFKLISQNVSELVCLHDPDDASYVYVSPSVEELTGYQPEEFVGKSPYEFFHPEDIALLAPDHANKQQGIGEPEKLVFRMKHKKDGYRWAESFSKPIFDEEGEVLFILSNTRDIHERKVAEDERRTYFNYYKILANKIPNGAVFLLDSNSRYLIAEGEELRRLGRDKENYIGKHTTEVLGDKGRREIQPYFHEVLKGERVRFEFENHGQYYSVLGEPYLNEEGDVLNAIILVQNITESKQFEDKLKQIVYELNFQKSALDISAYVSISDRDGVITYVNDRMCQISGYTYDELVGKNHRIFSSHYHPNSYWDDMYRSLKEGKVWHGEIKNRNKQGDYFWADTYIVPFKDAKGNVTQYVSIRFDMTQRKQVEEDLKAKNFELDSFVYHTSHDLRAPLTSILGLVNITLLEQDPANMKDYARMIQQSVLRLDTFIKSILTYSQNSNSEAKYVLTNLKELVEMNVEEVRFLKNFNDVDVSLDVEEEAPFYGDPLRLNIVFKNLITNAIKYADIRDKEYRYLKINIRQTADYVQMIFEDNGQGIVKEYQPRIFDMFYRANEGSDGSGLGLYIVKQTVERMGGAIRLQSYYRKGTTFTVEIPNKPEGVAPDVE